MWKCVVSTIYTVDLHCMLWQITYISLSLKALVRTLSFTVISKQDFQVYTYWFRSTVSSEAYADYCTILTVTRATCNCIVTL
jgi:hypothetical protein